MRKVRRLKVYPGGLSNFMVLSGRREAPSREGSVIANAAPQMTPSLDRTATLEVEKAALKLLERYQLLSVPVDVLSLAEKLGIRVFKASFEDRGIAGGVVKDSGRKGKIWVNRFDSEFRQTFTIAHEIGHWVMHLQPGDALSEPKVLIDWGKTDTPLSDKELAANRFAVALLMPAPLVASARDANGPDPAQLAEAFRVARDAMTTRLSEVDEL